MIKIATHARGEPLVVATPNTLALLRNPPLSKVSENTLDANVVRIRVVRANAKARRWSVVTSRRSW
eukprot:CAMPEP_0201865296 /NCGR_PEP_ID=MMETSP0902-20130614/196_1 /ASSEMBLY_ACC=CAM_ASM_000551 /TAXON_ID=420261 /ORGANISM="Thalassiosira antarctica, Strain CCMP982" /LENGTH=65 /DNA_ID=CAMNT_0048389999 /DNA_START=47 /DNA_END=241 /DNA_ORIENTATION=+